jgi:hypothetical protein
MIFLMEFHHGHTRGVDDSRYVTVRIVRRQDRKIWMSSDLSVRPSLALHMIYAGLWNIASNYYRHNVALYLVSMSVPLVFIFIFVHLKFYL